MDQKYFDEIKAREQAAQNGDVGAIQTSQLDIKPLIAEVERLTAENTTLKKAYELAEVKHAHWIEVDDDCSNIWECSHCGLVWEMSNDSAPRENEMFYCPRCGSLMDEKDDSHG